MMQLKILGRIVAVSVAYTAVAVLFQNCAPGKHEVTAASVQQLNVCENELKAGFESTYYGFARREKSCATCHDDAGKSGKPFASSDINLAYNTFSQLGYFNLNKAAVDPDHDIVEGVNNEITGGQLLPAFESMQFFWERSVSEYDVCKTGQPHNNGDIMLTAGKVPSLIYFGTPQAQVLSWDLRDPRELGTNEQYIEGIISAKFDVNLVNLPAGATKPIGYSISEPKVQLFNGSDEFVIQSVYVLVNNRFIVDGGLSWSALDIKVGGFGALDLAKNLSAENKIMNLKMEKISSTDRMSIIAKVMRIQPRDISGLPKLGNFDFAFTNDGGTADTSYSNSAIATLRVKTGAALDTASGKIGRWCITTSPATLASSDEVCPGWAGVNLPYLDKRGWLVIEPGVNHTANTNIPLAYRVDLRTISLAHLNLLQNDTANKVRMWFVDARAVLETVAEKEFRLDTVPPSPPEFTALFKTEYIGKSTQIADLTWQSLGSDGPNGTDPSQLTYCVRTVAANTPANNITITAINCTFVAKPDFVTLGISGMNEIYAAVRDKAGNVSTTFPVPSDTAGAATVSLNNTVGPVTFLQLSGLSLNAGPDFANDASAVLQGRCFSCHDGSSQTYNGKTTTTNLKIEAIANPLKKPEILTRIFSTDVGNRMPANGTWTTPAEIRQRALIELWTNMQ